MMYDQNTTCADVLKAWDEGDSIWTVEMGGLGPGYEQAIQVAFIELLRMLVTEQVKLPETKEEHEAVRDRMHTKLHEVCKWPGMGLSGAQAGAAMNLAGMFYKQGPKGALDKAPTDRHIQACKEWPHAV